MAAPLFPMKSSKFSFLLLLLPTVFLFFGTSSAVPQYVEIPTSTAINATTYVISPFSPKSFVRSANFDLNSTECVQYSFKLLERRVRLHSYTCLLNEGGFCTLDKFSFPDDREGCTYLRPWTHKVETWSFYFVLEKRPRKYGKAYHARQKLKVKRQTSSKKEMSTEPVGKLELYGVVPCSQVCGGPQDVKLGSKADGTFHKGRSHRLQY